MRTTGKIIIYTVFLESANFSYLHELSLLRWQKACLAKTADSAPCRCCCSLQLWICIGSKIMIYVSLCQCAWTWEGEGGKRGTIISRSKSNYWIHMFHIQVHGSSSLNSLQVSYPVSDIVTMLLICSYFVCGYFVQSRVFAGQRL